MLHSVTQKNIKENYEESQERMVVSLLDQVDGYTSARLQIALQHIQLTQKTKNAAISFADVF